MGGGIKPLLLPLLLLLLLLLICLIATPADATCAQMEKYYLLSHACDFYFEGYYNFPPSLELAENTTYPLTVLARDGTPISGIKTIHQCKIFTPNPLSYTGQEHECPVNFTIDSKNQIQTDRFSQHGALLGTLQASVIMIYLSNIALEDGTLLTPGDGNTKFLESRRCVAFIRLPDLDGTIRAMRAVSSEFEVFGTKVAEEFLKTMKEVEAALKKALGHDMDPLGAAGSGIPFGMFFP
ncbi:hypothetical protein SELMODRAFT_431385 [Selaginella moellendorffii]|uniref:Uncharacterized protein n=1 Tax=Selaginella moellendorffii TaxID=88036 RepID=D8TCF4_SELML|nr:uncharacterized protein LOC9640838 [Selaginella moellendorffii]EFJ05681.1 hypothetical protein SELMODRAFT_431385 [Selaginella moellendorffii]|eukprot:XP_002993260.1 uncharacterized protein LOC9640838 [Selaginella moellendorffii]